MSAGRLARRFLNDALQVLWPAFDRALGAFLKIQLEPLLRASTPAFVDGCSFESLSFGTTPMQASAWFISTRPDCLQHHTSEAGSLHSV